MYILINGMKPQRINGKTPRKPQRAHRNKGPKEPVEVCARVRNLTNVDEDRCLTVKNDTTVRLKGPPPDNKVTECQFYQVFDENVGQKTLFDTVAFPMVEDLVKGKNGLLFTYGVTSSGKTYTMTGSLDQPGFLPRCLDMIFTSVGDYQANKYVFLPDGMNGFSIQSETDALQDRQERDIMPGLTKTPGKHTKPPPVPCIDRYDLELCQSENVNPEYRYALFISFVEIYNDLIYDLLQDLQLDPFNRPKPPQCKRLREDRNKNMFVYDVSQIEVKSTEEAFAAFKKGQERRKVAHTNLNAESSRGHSIFSIRLVQAPLDPLGEDLLMEKSFIITSQLCLVDLAGSERMRRTHAVGDRVKEASSINGSLMALRRCLEQLRANQKSNAQEMVKYRNSKLTHLFKSYFEGNGKVKMVVCLNPNAQEYDENCHVAQFAEVASQVEVDRSDVYRLDAAALRKRVLEQKEAKRAQAELERKQRLTAARSLAHEAAASRHIAQRKTSGSGRRPKTPSTSEGTTTESVSDTPTEYGVSDWETINYNSVSQFPGLQIVDAADSTTLQDIINVVRGRLQNRGNYSSTISSLRSNVRSNLNSLYHSDRDVHVNLAEAEKNLATKQKEIEKMERNVKKLESKNQVLTRTTQVFEKEKQHLQEQLNDAEGLVKSQKKEVRKLETQMRGVVASTKAQAEKEYDKKVRDAQLNMQEKMLAQNEKLHQLKTIISDGREGRTAKRNHITARRVVRPSVTPLDSTHTMSTRSSRYHRRRSRSAENLLSDRSRLDKSISKTSTKATSTVQLPKARASHVELPKSSKVSPHGDVAPPVVHKHRRSASGGGPWLEHRPDTTVSTETILQPRIRAKVVSVPSPKDVAGASKYLLTHQSEDNDGEIETQLVKGEVFHTRTGGQQVQFVDIETLKQSDPQKGVEAPRKRKSSVESEPDTWTDVETRCSYGIGNNLNAERPTSASAKRKK